MSTTVQNNGGHPSSSVDSSITGYNSGEPQAFVQAHVQPNNSGRPNTPDPAAIFYTENQCVLPSAFQPVPGAANGIANLFAPPETFADLEGGLRYLDEYHRVRDAGVAARQNVEASLITESDCTILGPAVDADGKLIYYEEYFFGRPFSISILGDAYTTDGAYILYEGEYEIVGESRVSTDVEIPIDVEEPAARSGAPAEAQGTAAAGRADAAPDVSVLFPRIEQSRIPGWGGIYDAPVNAGEAPLLDGLQAAYERSCRQTPQALWDRYAPFEGMSIAPVAEARVAVPQPSVNPPSAGPAAALDIGGLDTIVPSAGPSPAPQPAPAQAAATPVDAMFGSSDTLPGGVRNPDPVLPPDTPPPSEYYARQAQALRNWLDMDMSSVDPIRYESTAESAKPNKLGVSYGSSDVPLRQGLFEGFFKNIQICYMDGVPPIILTGQPNGSLAVMVYPADTPFWLHHDGAVFEEPVNGEVYRFIREGGRFRVEVVTAGPQSAPQVSPAPLHLVVDQITGTPPPAEDVRVGRSPILPEAPETTGARAGCAERPAFPVANACGLGDVQTVAQSWTEGLSSIARSARQFISSIIPGEAAADIGLADTVVPEKVSSADQTAPSEKSMNFARTAAGFFGGLATILGLHKVEEMVGLSDIPVVGKLLEGLNFFGGHVVGTSIGTGMSLSEAATLPQSLESFYRSGGTFMLLMPGIVKGLNAIGLNPDNMTGIGFEATAVGAGIGGERGIAALGEIAVGYLERKGLTGAAGLVSKLFTRVIPGLGWGLLALDAATELPALVHAYGQGIASLMGVSAFDFNKGVLLAQRYYDARVERDPGFGFIWRRPDNYIAARNVMAEAGEGELDAIKYEIDSEFYQKADKLRTALEAVLAQLVMVDMGDDAQSQSLSVTPEKIEEMISARISAAMAAHLPDGIYGDALDNDCDAGASACMDDAEGAEIMDFEKFKQMVSEGYSIEDIRANFGSEAEFDVAANHFIGAVIDTLGQFTPPFGSVDFADNICESIRNGDPESVAGLVMEDVTALWDAQNVHRMAALLSSSEVVGDMLVADSSMITDMDEVMGYVRYDDSTGNYVINGDSPVYQAVDAMIKAAVASMPAEERGELLNMVIESVA